MTPDLVRAEIDGADGILEVFRKGDDWVEIAIWNPDGSRAEMSGNGTRIAARWLAEQTRSERVTVRVGPREVRARMLGGRPRRAGSRRGRRRGARGGCGHGARRGRRRQSACRRRGRSGRAAARRPDARGARTLPAAHERPGRTAVAADVDRGARLGARSGRDGVIGIERSRGRGGVRELAGHRALSRAATWSCGSRARARS